MEKNTIKQIYDKLVKEVQVGDCKSCKLRYYKSDLEREYLHSTGSTSFFGTRVPPRESITFLNVFKIVSDNLRLPNSFHQDYSLKQLYRCLCLSFYIKEYEKVKNIMVNDEEDNDDVENDKNKNLLDDNEIDDSIDSSLLSNIVQDMNKCYNDNDNDNNNNYHSHDKVIKSLVTSVFKSLDDNDELQNVWFNNLRFRQQPMISDANLNYFLYVCYQSNNDPTIMCKDFTVTYPLLPRSVPVLIYLVCFCYKLFLPYIQSKNSLAPNTRKMVN